MNFAQIINALSTDTMGSLSLFSPELSICGAIVPLGDLTCLLSGITLRQSISGVVPPVSGSAEVASAYGRRFRPLLASLGACTSITPVRRTICAPLRRHLVFEMCSKEASSELTGALASQRS